MLYAAKSSSRTSSRSFTAAFLWPTKQSSKRATFLMSSLWFLGVKWLCRCMLKIDLSTFNFTGPTSSATIKSCKDSELVNAILQATSKARTVTASTKLNSLLCWRHSQMRVLCFNRKQKSVGSKWGGSSSSTWFKTISSTERLKARWTSILMKLR